MGTLTEIAQALKNNNKKVQLIYAFNGIGKTRLSKEFKQLVTPKAEEDDTGLVNKQILYYNAFTEDLFYWDNDLANDAEPKLKIQPNIFTNWVLLDQGQEHNISKIFQYYTDEKLTPHFNAQYTFPNDKGEIITVPAFSEVTFSYERGNQEALHNIKISKGEESCFIWSVFFALLEQAIEVLKVADETERETDKFNNLEYVFIDDPVSSLDENHLIQMAIELAALIKDSPAPGPKFIITTHNVLFYNVLYNELKKNKDCYMLDKNEDGSYTLDSTRGDSNKNFSYHLHIKKLIEDAIKEDRIEKYHFTLLRNLYEKSANFLGYQKWSELLPEEQSTYEARIMNFYSHHKLSNEEISPLTPQEKQMVQFLLNHLIDNVKFWKEA